MAKPLLGVETILNAALEILDEHGSQGLSIRKLAASLQCSTRTLYQQVGKREQLIKQLLDYQFSGIELAMTKQTTWQLGVVNWSAAMRQSLLLHPNLSRLMTVANREAIANHVNQLLRVLLHHGFPAELALRSCRVLAHTVISLVMAEIDTPPIAVRRVRRTQREIVFEDLVISESPTSGSRQNVHNSPEVFSNAVCWLIRGIDAELPVVDG